jgi:hypothetical protein
VRIAFRQNGLALVREGLSGRERVVIDDLVPATAGMAIAPRAAPDDFGLAKSAAAPEAREGLAETPGREEHRELVG